MMADKPTNNQPDANTILPESQPALSTNVAQDADPSLTSLNGAISDFENKQLAEIVDELVHSAEVSVSGGSDTESSKARLGEKNHARSSSTIKKPQSFKSVSVNRTFLASKSTASSGTRPDSATGSASTTPQPTPSSSASRLKLVAKSGSSLGGSTKTLSNNGKPASAPDPNTVWNRNKPVSQPEQKKLSDEELMHKYGIHMAGRLGPEDTKGQSNWADIDDDEEWEPDTITWTDGTKITLPHESAASPSVAPATVDKEPVPVLAPPKIKSPAPLPSATVSPSVRPGAMASSKSLVLKGATEKPTLVTKPPAPPTPAKSPWAPLPPVDKVSPVQLDAVSTAGTSQSPVTKSAITPTTKEIAADDFSRSGFRDRHASNHSQLYNSHSGQYDPVPDHRRVSRNEPHGRQPAVLQRPQHHEQQGPAEPSAAFQTSRTSAQEGPYRRRGSSNVSGTSGILARKPYDVQPPSDSFQSRSGSVTGAESPISTHNQPTARLPVVSPYQPRLSPAHVHATPYYSSPAVDTQPADDREIQAVIMRERREQAIRRRSEQEAREEAARKARIAEKLKAMGPLPERNSPNKERGLHDSTDVPPEALADSPERDQGTANNRANGETKRAVSQVEKSQDQAVQGTHVPKTQHPTSWPEAPQHQDRYGSWGNNTQNASRNVWGAPGNDRSLGNGTFNPDLGSLPDSRSAPMGDRNHRPAPIGPPQSNGQQSHRPVSMSSNRLAPIGPPRGRSSNATQGPGEPGPSNPWKNFNIQEDDRRRALELQAKANALKEEATIPMNDDWRSRAATKTTSSASRQDTTITINSPNEVQPTASYDVSTASTDINAPRDDKPTGLSEEMRARMKGRMPSDYLAARLAREAKEAKEAAAKESGPTPEDRARWKGRMPSDYAAARLAREAAAAKMNGNRADYSRQSAAESSKPTVSSSAAQSRSGSRFFPSSRDIQSQDDYREQFRTKSPTPPPPTADGHPVFDGDSSRPHVALPPARPIVKLPPTNSAGPSPIIASAKPVAPVSFAAAAAAPSKTYQQSGVPRPSSRGRGYGGIHQTPYEISSQENWQEKINTLFGKNTSPAPTKSMAVDSSSRIALEHTHSFDPATVALPGLSHSVSSLTSDNSDYTSREMAEECFGEQEMGSLPTVRLPSEAPDALWQPAEVHAEPVPLKLRVDPISAEAWRFPAPEMTNGRNVIRISGPFMTEPKTVLMRYDNARSNSNQRRQGPRGGARRLSGRGGQRGGREHSDHSGEHSSHPPSRPSTRSGRGNFRSRMDNMPGRHPSTGAPSQWS